MFGGIRVQTPGPSLQRAPRNPPLSGVWPAFGGDCQRSRGFCVAGKRVRRSFPVFFLLGGSSHDKLPELAHQKALEKSRIRAVQCYDCPTRRCGGGQHT